MLLNLLTWYNQVWLDAIAIIRYIVCSIVRIYLGDIRFAKKILSYKWPLYCHLINYDDVYLEFSSCDSLGVSSQIPFPTPPATKVASLVAVVLLNTKKSMRSEVTSSSPNFSANLHFARTAVNSYGKTL